MDMFEVSFRFIVPVGLVLVMFGMGLSLGVEDFRRVVVFPRAVLTGMAGQLLLLPGLAFLLTSLIPMEPHIAMGLVILSACPGGVASNAIVFAARSDVALSITLTAISSVITVLTIPLIVSLGLLLHFGESGRAPEMPVLQTMGMLFVVTILPVSAGIFVRHRRRAFAERAVEPFRKASTVLLALIVIGVVGMQAETVAAALEETGAAALMLNVCAMAMGYTLARLVGLKREQVATITIEVGLQNGTLAVLVALTLLREKAFAIAPSIYAIIMLFTGGGFAAWFANTRRIAGEA